MRLNIPAGWEAVTPEWMTSALADAFPGVEVQDVRVELRDDGTNQRARLGLSYARGSGPATVFVKAADPEHTAVNARMGGVFNEPRLFASGVPLPIDHPQVYFTLIDEPHLDFIMVMEDIRARGCDPRDATRPMTVEQVANGVRGLAKLHSAFWGDRLRRYPQLSWVEPFVSWRGMAVGIDMGLERAGEGVPPEVQRMTGKEIMRDVWAPFIATLAHGGQTLLHGDPHIGNTYVCPTIKWAFSTGKCSAPATRRSTSATSSRAHVPSRTAAPPSGIWSRSTTSRSKSRPPSSRRTTTSGGVTGHRRHTD